MADGSQRGRGLRASPRGGETGAALGRVRRPKELSTLRLGEVASPHGPLARAPRRRGGPRPACARAAGELLRPTLLLALDLPDAAAAPAPVPVPAPAPAPVPDLHPAPSALSPPALVASKGAPEPSKRERVGRTLQVVGLSAAGVGIGAGVAAGIARDSGNGWLSGRSARLVVGWTLVGGVATFVVGSLMRPAGETPEGSTSAGAPLAATARPDLSAPPPRQEPPGADGFTVTERELMARAEAGRQRRSSGNLTAGLGLAATLVGLALAPTCASASEGFGSRGLCQASLTGLLGGPVGMIAGLVVAGKGDSDRRDAEAEWAATHGGGRLQLQ